MESKIKKEHVKLATSIIIGLVMIIATMIGAMAETNNTSQTTQIETTEQKENTITQKPLIDFRGLFHEFDLIFKIYLLEMIIFLIAQALILIAIKKAFKKRKKKSKKKRK